MLKDFLHRLGRDFMVLIGCFGFRIFRNAPRPKMALEFHGLVESLNYKHFSRCSRFFASAMCSKLRTRPE